MKFKKEKKGKKPQFGLVNYLHVLGKRSGFGSIFIFPSNKYVCQNPLSWRRNAKSGPGGGF